MNIEPTELLNVLKREPQQPNAPVKRIADTDAPPSSDEKWEFSPDQKTQLITR